ncbi:P-loop containing nucleoside triphosphate hydrolase protein, partial [Mycena sanguinolenta]
MLPSEPQIFHGREAELGHVLKLLREEAPRIAILGAGGMGKTSLARAVLHHPETFRRYNQHRYFVVCDTVTTKGQLVSLIGTHLGLKAGKDLTRPVIEHFLAHPDCLLILDNLETLWEPTKTRGSVEEFLAVLTDISHLAVIITMRGAERPAKVQWTRPFLPPLNPLQHNAAHQIFTDIADDGHDSADVHKLLLMTDNIPLVINLIAHLVDLEGCSAVLSRWEGEKTSVISEGYDKRTNLHLSISLSLSSSRVTSSPHSQHLLSLLSLLPDGLSNVELLQSKLPIPDILTCKTTLIRTSLAYIDGHQRLKALVPIREHMQQFYPPEANLVQPLLNYFQELLELCKGPFGTLSTSVILARIKSNFSNIQNMLSQALHVHNSDIVKAVYCALYLNDLSEVIGYGSIPVMDTIPSVLPRPRNHKLEVFYTT